MSRDRRKSAKDLAFDRERANYRKQLREKERKIQGLEQEVYRLEEESDAQADLIRQKDDWIQRLLEYIDWSEGERQGNAGEQILPVRKNRRRNAYGKVSGN